MRSTSSTVQFPFKPSRDSNLATHPKSIETTQTVVTDINGNTIQASTSSPKNTLTHITKRNPKTIRTIFIPSVVVN